MSDSYSIQDLCDKTGLSRRTIHFYCQQGILPPPTGAGLAAHYDDSHLQRLLLIPALRNQGLRLDEIRIRLSGMDQVALQSLSYELREPPTSPAPAYPHQTFTHHALPAGMVLVTPESLSATDRNKLTQLLEFARQLFSTNPKE